MVKRGSLHSFSVFYLLLTCLGLGPGKFDVDGALTHQSRHGHDCSLCHAPLSDGTKGPGEVLWSRSEEDLSLHVYTTLSGNRGTLNSQSKLCLSCHDGGKSMENHIGSLDALRAVPGIGPDLSDDHPVGVEYPPRDRRGGLLRGYRYPPRGNVKLLKTNGVERVECTSCHDPHGSPNRKLLRDGLDGSTLCRDCHDQ